MSEVREQCEISMEKTWKGGQHVGTDPMILTVTHRETGIKIVLPPLAQRSQHKRVQAAIEAMEYLLVSA